MLRYLRATFFRPRANSGHERTEMKLLKKQISEKDGAGSVVLRAEEPEDMWHIYNLIHVSDSVKTTTIRKVRAAPVRRNTCPALAYRT